MKILVSLDSSSSSQRAIDFALARPWAEDDEFLIVSVIDADRGDMSMASAMTNPNQTFKAESQRIVSDAKEVLQNYLPTHKFETRTLSGPIKNAIIECAKNWSADLILLGSQGRQGLNRLVLGSVAEEVLRDAPCSVQIVRRKFSRREDQS
ncbi:universal stress protein [bacterium]|nr:universal stress protein [bacterium]MBP9807357.1 universal stress protein [bacterium]